MAIDNQSMFQLAWVLYGLAFLACFWRGERKRVGLLGAVAVLGFIYIGWRYWTAWPMTPMYLGTAALPPILIVAAWFSSLSAPEPQRLFILRRAIGLCFLVGAASVLFPKDFYLPFLKTTSVFSHLHLLFTVLGKAALLLAGLWAWVDLGLPNPDRLAQSRCQIWLMWGFALWTLSLFSGEIWSYLGWGIPVVWDDAVIVCFMATWFYYTALLHLHLTRSWTAKSRSWAALIGLVLILVLNCSPDLGPYRPLVR